MIRLIKLRDLGVSNGKVFHLYAVQIKLPHATWRRAAPKKKAAEKKK
jgi:hypothetical protein